MYQNVYCSVKNHQTNVHLWDDKVGYQNFTVKNYAYMKASTGTYRSLYGDKLKRVTYWKPEDNERGQLFESDVFPATRVLIDKYGDSDEISEGHRILSFDIEVDSSNGFPDWTNPINEITSIALYDSVTKNYFVCVKSQTMKGYSTDDTVVEVFESEKELLQRFFQKYLEINPSIITGWNVDQFDIPYLYNRALVVLGSHVAKTLSPINHVFRNNRRERWTIAGVSVLDYLTLYRKFTYKQQPSYRLGDIGEFEVNIKKIEYDGSLSDLYNTNIEKFVDYNIRDVKIVVELDKKLDFIKLVQGICHIGHVPYEDFIYSSRYIEGAMLVYMRRLNIIAPNKNLAFQVGSDNKMSPSYDKNEERKKQLKYTGAYVKEPIPGTYDWVYDLDVTSMYPSVIMSLNVSPETKRGKLIGWNTEEYLKKTKKTYSVEIDGKVKDTLSEQDVALLLKTKNYTIASNGVLYKQDKKGLIPSILESWFNDRVEFRRLAAQHVKQGDKVKAEYFNRRQHIQKIMLNTVYGVFGLPVFRFYDTDNSEATTLTGQQLIKFSQRMVNYVYNNELNDDKDHVLYTDTDSCFVSAIPLIKHRYPEIDIKNDSTIVNKVLEITSEIQNFLNLSYDSFAQKFLNINGNHKFNIKQEVIAKRIFLVSKKRYGQWIINDNGHECDRIDVKGLDIIKSSFPAAFKKLMQGVLKDILFDVDKKDIDHKILSFQKDMKNLLVTDIALPTGVKGLKKYTVVPSKMFKSDALLTPLKKGAPVHVKAAIRHNDMLKYFNQKKQYEKIRNNEKIKWTYLKQNTLGLDVIAFKGHNDPPLMMKFINENVDHTRLFNGALRKKIEAFYDALKWKFPIDEINTLTKFFNGDKK